MSDGTPTRRRRLTKTHKRLLGATGSIAVVVAVFVFVLPQFANYRDVLDVVRSLGWQDWLVLAGAVILNLVTFPPPWMAALPGLGFREAMAMTQASTALSIVSPAGAAVGMAASYSMLRSWRFGPAAVGLAVAIAGIWNQLVNLAFPVVALALLTAQDQDHPALRTAALIGVVVLAVAVTAFALILSRAEWARRIGDLAARLDEPSAAGRAPGAGRVGWRVVRPLPLACTRAAPPSLARHNDRDARRTPHGVRAASRLPPRHRGLRRGGHRDRGVRRVGARPDPRRASTYARPASGSSRSASPARSSPSERRMPRLSPRRCSTAR